jgi:hypothetical protein
MSNHAAELIDIGNGYCIRWPDHDIKVLLEFLKKKDNGLCGEATVIAGDATLCESLGINLNTEPTTKKIAKKVAEYDKRLKVQEWARLIETTCVLVLRHHRTGEAPIRLSGGCDVQPRPFLVNPLVYDRLASIIYGPGGIGKSYLAMLSCLMVESSGGVAGMRAQPGRTAYIDWESDHDDLKARAERIRRGHPDLGKGEPLYLRCYAPLKEELARVQRMVAEHQITFVVIDSIGPACGGELEKPETVMDLFRCLRRLNIAVLLIGHPPRCNDPDKELDVFGSTFFRYNVRTLWEMKGTQEPGDNFILAGLYHRKVNLGPKHAALGLRINFGVDTVRFETMNLTEAPELEKDLPLSQRIDGTLATRPKTPTEIAKDLGLPENKIPQIRNRLNEGKGRRFVQLDKVAGENRWGRLTREHA